MNRYSLLHRGTWRVLPLWMAVLWLTMTGEVSHPDTRFPEPLGYVSDYAGVFDDNWRARTRSVCQDLERKTGVEMVIVTVPDLGPYPTANDYASAVYQRWGIGSTHRDHGVLVLVVVGSHRAAVTLGRGMAMTVMPSHLNEISGRYFDPMFRTGHYGEGLYRSAVVLASISQDVRAGDETRTHVKGLGTWLTILTVAGVLTLLWWISRPELRHPFGKLRRGEFWSSGQGGFGGNFGGFEGGTSGEGWK